MQKTLWGLMTGFGIAKIKDSSDISGLGTIQWFADAGGAVYGVNANGKIFKESFPAAADWALDHTPAGTFNGQGLIGDQKGRLLYIGDTAIGKLDAGTYTDAFKTGLNSYSVHPADTYMDMVLIGNKSAVALLDNADNLNTAAFTLPSSMTVDCLKTGKQGVLIGANLGYRGALILWDAQADRSITPWIWTNGKVLSIERTDTGWIVVTQKEILLTNGYTTQKLFALLDDPLGSGQWNVGPQGAMVLNGKLFLCSQYGNNRAPAGLFVIELATQLFEFAPMSAYGAAPVAIYAPKSTLQEIVLSYSDSFASKTYIGVVSTTSISPSVYIPEVLASSSSDKAAEAAILNISLSSIKSGVQAITFNVALKIYSFTRALYGVSQTSGLAAAANQLPVDGTNAGFRRARVGDEVTILQGVNAGSIRHIASIANSGASNEVWTLDSALSAPTEANVSLSVQPFLLVETKSVLAASEIPPLFFDIKNKYRGKKFLLKIVIDGMTNAQVEINRSDFVYDDLGYAT